MAVVNGKEIEDRTIDAGLPDEGRALSVTNNAYALCVDDEDLPRGKLRHSTALSAHEVDDLLNCCPII